jgi:hypothetical protein
VTGSAFVRRIIPAVVGLALFVLLATLWLTGDRQTYMAFFRLLGLDPFAFPFLDNYAVPAASGHPCRAGRDRMPPAGHRHLRGQSLRRAGTFRRW